jgi:glycosyltransferase involved in cell wall biosynthesis
MIVTHFNRGPMKGNYTFEQLFGAIRTALHQYIIINNHNVPAGISRTKALWWAKKRVGAINHITGDVNFLAMALPPNKTIITVHDIGHYSQTLKGWKKVVYKKIWLDIPLSRVKYLTAISEFTKQELVNHLLIPPEKITVIPNPVLPGFKFVEKKAISEKPVILQIGSGHNKNVSRLIEAVKGLEVKLLLVNKLYDSNILNQLRDAQVDYEQRVDLDFEGLKQAYIDCDVLFFASSYEGFGMPILEAQATGRPVITSNIAAMPEAAGKNGALFVNPFDVSDIRTSISRLISDKELYQLYVKNGLENVKQYEVDIIAKSYISLYKSLDIN